MSQVLVWLEGLRRVANAPVLEMLRYVDDAPLLADVAIAPLVDLLNDDDDPNWVATALARIVPDSAWARLVTDPSNGHGWTAGFLARLLSDRTSTAAGDRVVGSLLEGLVRLEPDANEQRIALLYHLQTIYRQGDLVSPVVRACAWDVVVALCDDPDEETRWLASSLLLSAGQTNPALHEVVGRQLTRVLEGIDFESYDETVDIEEWLRALARSGTEFRSLAPRLASIMTCDHSLLRVAASRVAMAMGEPSLAAAVRAALGKEEESALARARERALHCATLWRLTGEAKWFEQMRAEAGDAILALHEVTSAFEAFPVRNDQLALLADLATAPGWSLGISSVLGGYGPRAAAALATISVPPTGSLAWVYYREARWKVGLESVETMTDAIAPHLAFAEWSVFVASNARTEFWFSRIRRELAARSSKRQDDDPPVVSSLVRHPEIGLHFLPDFVTHGYDTAIVGLWRRLPKDRFWTCVRNL